MELRWTFVFSVLISTFLIVEAGPSVPLEDDVLVVNTDVGAIRGLRAEDGDYTMFLGIPYADVDADNPFGVSIITKYYHGFENLSELCDLFKASLNDLKPESNMPRIVKS